MFVKSLFESIELILFTFKSSLTKLFFLFNKASLLLTSKTLKLDIISLNKFKKLL